MFILFLFAVIYTCNYTVRQASFLLHITLHRTRNMVVLSLILNLSFLYKHVAHPVSHMSVPASEVVYSKRLHSSTDHTDRNDNFRNYKFQPIIIEDANDVCGSKSYEEELEYNKRLFVKYYSLNKQ